MVNSAIIYEGSAEKVIINILLDNNKMKFSREDLLEGEPIRERNAKKFATRYLRKSFDNTLTIYRILDSRSEKFNLPKLYEKKIKVVDVITAPEIEMLVIHGENQYDKYCKSGKKTSDFCKQDLGLSDVKKEEFVEDYFSDVEFLITCLQTHKSKAKTRKNEKTIFDLIK